MSDSISDGRTCLRVPVVWVAVVRKWKLDGRELEGSQAVIYIFVAVGNVSMVKSSFVDVRGLEIVERVGAIELNC
jgi:hypothetical protein